MQIEFLRPWALLLFPLCIVLVWLLSKKMRIRSRMKKASYIAIRVVILLLLVFSLSGLRIQMNSKMTTTIFLVDVSDSMGENVENAQNFVRNAISELPDDNKTGIVIFGADTRIEQFVTDRKIFTEIQSEVLATATNLEQGVQTALAMFPEESAKRIVLLTDGVQNEGDILNTASSFLLHDIELKVVKYDAISGDEVYITDVTVPDVIHIGDSFQVQVDVYSNVATNAVITLYSGRTFKGQQSVILQKGTNKFVFLDEGVETGTQSYRVTIEAEKDTLSANNSYSAFTQIDAKPRILVVEGENGFGEAFRDILETCGYYYDVVTPSGVPNELSDLLLYKTVVLIDVHLDDLRTGFTDCMESYVKDYAGGLIVTGGDNSFALGNYQDSVLEDILPVSMSLKGENEIPKMAIALVIDHSGSMSSSSIDGGDIGITCMDIAKQAAVSALSSLREIDEIGVLAFDDKFTWAVSLQPATNLDSIKKKINSIEVGGGTSIYPALEEAVKAISNSDAQIKHIILLTDGQDGYNQYNPVLKVLTEQGITLSTVAVGNGADVTTMQMLAEEGGGRYYYSDASQKLPRIFAQEIFLSGKRYLINEEFTPILVNRHDIIKGIFDNGTPNLYGYIASTAKPTSIVILESHMEDPILTVWQYGLGKTVAWNTDVTNQWTMDFAGWTPYAQLWRNILDYTISDTTLGGDSLEVISHSTSATIVYEPEEYTTDTTITAVVMDENSGKQEVTFYPTAPGTYEAEIPMTEQGVYSINIRNRQGDEIVKNVNTATAMQYSVEYRMDGNSTSLEKFVIEVGGIWITEASQVFNTMLHQVKANKDMTDYILLIALVLFLLDIIVRRWNLDYMTAVSRGFKTIGKKVVRLGRLFVTIKNKDSKQKNSESDILSTHDISKMNTTTIIDESDETGKKKDNKEKKQKLEKHPKKKTKQQSSQVIDTAMLLKKKQERQ